MPHRTHKYNRGCESATGGVTGEVSGLRALLHTSDHACYYQNSSDCSCWITLWPVPGISRINTDKLCLYKYRQAQHLGSFLFKERSNALIFPLENNRLCAVEFSVLLFLAPILAPVAPDLLIDATIQYSCSFLGTLPTPTQTQPVFIADNTSKKYCWKSSHFRQELLSQNFSIGPVSPMPLKLIAC